MQSAAENSTQRFSLTAMCRIFAGIRWERLRPCIALTSYCTFLLFYFPILLLADYLKIAASSDYETRNANKMHTSHGDDCAQNGQRETRNVAVEQFHSSSLPPPHSLSFSLSPSLPPCCPSPKLQHAEWLAFAIIVTSKWVLTTRCDRYSFASAAGITHMRPRIERMLSLRYVHFFSTYGLQAKNVPVPMFFSSFFF